MSSSYSEEEIDNNSSDPSPAKAAERERGVNAQLTVSQEFDESDPLVHLPKYIAKARRFKKEFTGYNIYTCLTCNTQSVTQPIYCDECGANYFEVMSTTIGEIQNTIDYFIKMYRHHVGPGPYTPQQTNQLADYNGDIISISDQLWEYTQMCDSYKEDTSSASQEELQELNDLYKRDAIKEKADRTNFYVYICKGVDCRNHETRILEQCRYCKQQFNDPVNIHELYQIFINNIK